MGGGGQEGWRELWRSDGALRCKPKPTRQHGFSLQSDSRRSASPAASFLFPPAAKLPPALDSSGRQLRGQSFTVSAIGNIPVLLLR